ncbi:hypothetical protein F1559_004645 [Cyanidiococcus yangmingshanensis]|uniref:Protein OS9-like domain-containing protein n=1 Tax=Cyanidiococcus yangmingshanensis TaxID=2690220 RepID=A0A7J7IMA2_9RHOD|nr:hypothetical protein F1559_004645 [Cyanidiococcus yangmingshanensis]
MLTRRFLARSVVLLLLLETSTLLSWSRSTLFLGASAATLPIAEEILRPGFRLFPRTQQSEANAIFFRDLLLPTVTYSIHDAPDSVLYPTETTATNFAQPTTETSFFDARNWSEVIRMNDSQGRLHICRSPGEQRSATNVDLAGGPDSHQNATVDMDELLYRLLADKCFYRQEGWWVFEFCFLRHVRHFHWERRRSSPREQQLLREELASLSNQHSFPEGANGEAGRKRFLKLLLHAQHIPIDGSVNLVMKDEVCMGHYDKSLDQEMKRNRTLEMYPSSVVNPGEYSSISKEPLLPMASPLNDTEKSSEADGRILRGLDGLARSTHLVQPYTKDGDFCDVTGRPRHTKVLYRCVDDVPGFALATHTMAGASFIASVQERSTCEYELVFVTDAVCMHPAFGSSARRSIPIVCERLEKAASTINFAPDVDIENESRRSTEAGARESHADVVR